MAERNHGQERGRSEVREHAGLDRELDLALAKYASIQPRPGLAERVLANLRAEHQLATPRRFWRWSVLTATAALAAALIVTLVLTWRYGSRRPENGASQSLTIAQGSPPRAQNVPDGEKHGVRPREPIFITPSSARRSVHRSTRPGVRPRTAVAAPPKFDRFPSPHPLSEQEQMLADYVTKYPKTAALVAQARAEALQKEMEEEANRTALDGVR